MISLQLEGPNNDSSCDLFERSFQIIAKSCYARTFDDLHAVMDILRHVTPIQAIVALVVRKDGECQPTLVDSIRLNSSSDWIEHYIHSNLVRLDPVVDKVLHCATPLLWNDDLLRQLSSTRHQNFLRCAGRFGASSGLLYPFPNHQNDDWLLLYTQIDSTRINEISSNMRLLSALLQYPSEAISRIYYEMKSSPLKQALTSRELQVLNWATHGKTSPEIAAILSISERTVKFHLSNTYEKLGVINRQQAIAKAIHNRLF